MFKLIQMVLFQVHAITKRQDDMAEEEEGDTNALLFRQMRIQRKREEIALKKQVLEKKRRDHERSVEKQLDVHVQEFRKGLEGFARRYGRDMDKDTTLQQTFYKLCARVGLDPVLMAQSASVESASGGNRKQYLYSVGVAVLDVCAARRDFDGGLCDIDVLVDRIQERGGSSLRDERKSVVRKDILAAVEELAVLGHGICVLNFDGKDYVKSAPTELSMDCTRLLELFHTWEGRFTRREAMDALQWTEQRVADGLSALAREGLVLIDDPGEAMPRLYWCPAVQYHIGLAL
ncbi:Vacuolar protein sorting-associated protein 22-like protein 1 [Picochlorum sp. SENEW3]|nr:Vacuolar protein sorting-associated protein 22-like protein 1 [Picochlorum sp. SENEW3]